jgi:hypothetical protein
MIGGCVVAIAGYAMLVSCATYEPIILAYTILQLAAKTASVRYGGCFLVASGVFPGSPVRVSRSSEMSLADKSYRW